MNDPIASAKVQSQSCSYNSLMYQKGLLFESSDFLIDRQIQWQYHDHGDKDAVIIGGFEATLT